MKVFVENKENNICLINVSISKEEINKSFDEITQNSLNTKDIKQTFSSLVQNQYIEKANTLAMEEFKIQPVGKMTFNGSEPQRDADFKFTLTLEVLPAIELPKNVENLSIEVEEAPFDPALYQQYMLKLQRTKGKGSEVTENRLPQENEIVFIESSARYNNELIFGMEKQKMAITLTPQYQTNKEFADVARTLKVGETGSFKMTLPADFPQEELQNKEIEISILLTKIMQEDLPKVDESFAKELGFKDFKDMQMFVTKEIFNHAIASCQQDAEEKLLSKLVDSQDFMLPKSLVELYIKDFLMQARHFYINMGLSAEQLEEKMQECMSECEQRAAFMAKRQAFLMAFGYSRNISISDKDIDDEVEKLAKASRQNSKELKDHIMNSAAFYELQDRILAEKALKLLYSTVKKNVIPAKK